MPRDYGKATRRYEDGGIIPDDGEQTVNRADKGDKTDTPFSIESLDVAPTAAEKASAKADLGVLLKRRAKNIAGN